MEEIKTGWLNQRVEGEIYSRYCALSDHVFSVYDNDKHSHVQSRIPISPQTEIKLEATSSDSQFYSLVINSSSSDSLVLDVQDRDDAYSWFKTLKGNKKVSMDDLRIITTLGNGYYGKVLLVEHKTSKELYALKVIKKSKFSNANHQFRVIFGERNFLAKANSPFIVNLKFCFETNAKYYFGLEYVPGGDLFYQMSQRGTLPIAEAKLYIAEVAIALNYIHSLGFVYRDLKPENIMIDSNGHIKLADFGFAKSLDESATSFVGTSEYMAPEIIKHHKYGIEVDFWGLGILLFEMLTGTTPYYSDNKKVTLDAIVNYQPCLLMIRDKQAKDLVSKLLVKDPKLRMTYQQLKQHQFFEDLDWSQVEQRLVQPKYVPNCSNLFNPENVDEDIRILPARDSEDDNGKEYHYFAGFSFVEDFDINSDYESEPTLND